jgi:acyl-coenzyme A synthetase/AMP-(fatty) acid ligase
VDVLPSVAAASWPNRTALRTDTGPITFAELDREISRLASGIRELIGGDGSVVAVSATLGTEFPITYYAVARSGNVVAPVNPRLGADVLERLVLSVHARAVVLDHAMHERVRPMLARSPLLEHTVVFAGRGALTCAELAGRGDLLVEPRDRDENELAAIRFAGGRAGHPNAAGRSHHRLKVDAARLAEAQGLSEDAVVLNALPGYDQDHLNAAMLAGAAQVLCASPDPAVVARDVRRHNASHLSAPPDYLVLDRRSWQAELSSRAVAS